MESDETGGEVLHPLAALLRRYAYAYTAAHDFDVCRAIMVEDYELTMGEARITGRDCAYIPAAARQFGQYPGLGFTVHELVLGTDRAALRFTEHGRSRPHGAPAAWSGISLYRWDGSRLTGCRVEQDYHARRRQQRVGSADPVLPPALDPWTAASASADPAAEAAVRRWLDDDGLRRAPAGCLDDERCAPTDRLVLADPVVTVLDLFSAGPRVAFHVLVAGGCVSGPGTEGRIGEPGTLFASGLVTVTAGSVTDIAVVTDRLPAERRLRQR